MLSVLNVPQLMCVRANGLPETSTFMHSKLIKFFTSSVGHIRQSRVTVVTVPVIVSIITIRLTAARSEPARSCFFIKIHTYNYLCKFLKPI